MKYKRGAGLLEQMWESGSKDRLAKGRQELLMKQLLLGDLRKENQELSSKFKEETQSPKKPKEEHRFDLQHLEIENEVLAKKAKAAKEDLELAKRKQESLHADRETYQKLAKELKDNHCRLKLELDQLQRDRKEKFKGSKTGGHQNKKLPKAD